jgi:hypothetical protein
MNTIDVKARRVGPRPKRAKSASAKRNRAHPRKSDPLGRVDILASRIVEELVSSANNPIARAVHRQLRPEIDQAFHELLGPRNPRARKVREYVRRGADLIADIRQAQLDQQAGSQARQARRPSGREGAAA